MSQCPSTVKVRGRVVHCTQATGHLGDGSTVFAYHVGAPAKRRARGAPSPAGTERAAKGYAWTTAEQGTDITDRLYDSKRDTGPRVDRKALDLFNH